MTVIQWRRRLWYMRVACPTALVLAALLCIWCIVSDRPTLAAVNGFLVGVNAVLTHFQWFVLQP